MFSLKQTRECSGWVLQYTGFVLYGIIFLGDKCSSFLEYSRAFTLSCISSVWASGRNLGMALTVSANCIYVYDIWSLLQISKADVFFMENARSPGGISRAAQHDGSRIQLSCWNGDGCGLAKVGFKVHLPFADEEGCYTSGRPAGSRIDGLQRRVRVCPHVMALWPS
jgi:hypothetical protein